MNWKNNLAKFFGFCSKEYQFQMFTYFLPCPPVRKSSYREKQFDRVINLILGSGYEIVHFKTQHITREEMSGMWILFLLKSGANVRSLNDLLSFEEESDEGEFVITT